MPTKSILLATALSIAVINPSRDGDSPVLPDLLGQFPEGEQIGTVTAEGAYDTRARNGGLGGYNATMRRGTVKTRIFRSPARFSKKIQENPSCLRKLANLIFDKQANKKHN